MLGSIILTLALLASIFSLIMYFLSSQGYKNTVNYARIGYHTMSVLIILASALLLYFILTHQYIYKYVYEYSNDDLSTGYLISTFWAGQEGSFLLWCLLAAVIGLILQSYTSKRGELEFSVMAVYSLSTTFLLALVSPALKNPFAYLWSESVYIDINNINQALLNNPFVQQFLFSGDNQQNFFQLSPSNYAALKNAGIGIEEILIHGKGLNPLLQNFWMQIHPPILFGGFALMSVPFTFAVAALLKNNYRNWIRQSFPWLLGAAGVLGLGIMLGGYWAYGVLGWGGYWAWDPVENSSLVPWLVSVAALHTMIVQRKTQSSDGSLGRFARTNLILSILAYVLVIYSTFLTRSGILGDASVHSFVDPGKYAYFFLLFFILSFTGLGVFLIVRRWRDFEDFNTKDENGLSRELSLFTAAVVLAASALIIFVGTSAPIIKKTVEPSFYNQMHIPLAIIIGLLNALSITLRWRKSTLDEIVKKLTLAGILSFISTIVIVVLGGVYNIMMILLALSSAFALFVNGEIAIKIIQGNPRMLGAYLSHIGISLFLLGVIGSSAYSKEEDAHLEKGKPQTVLGHIITFQNISPIENNTKYAFKVKVQDGASVKFANPVMYQSSYNMGLMKEPDILSGFFGDLYLSPLGYDDGTAEVNSGTELQLTMGQETEFQKLKIKYLDFIKPDMQAMQGGGDVAMGVKLAISNGSQTIEKDAMVNFSGGQKSNPPVVFDEMNLSIQVGDINPDDRTVKLQVKNLVTEAELEARPEIFSVAISTKPFVNLVWFGVVFVVAGFLVSMTRRMKETV